MEIVAHVVNTNERFEAFRALLKTSNLPHADLNYQEHVLVGYYENDELVGTGGLEVYDGHALLRSLAVKIGARGLSIGSFITKDLIAQARQRKMKGIYLLTETAHGFFQHKGFKDVDRSTVPDAVQSSSEFSTVCPTTAACMFLDLS